MLRAKGADDILVFGGGIIPDGDIAGLKDAGIKEIFRPGSSTDETIKFITDHVDQQS